MMLHELQDLKLITVRVILVSTKTIVAHLKSVSVRPSSLDAPVGLDGNTSFGDLVGDGFEAVAFGGAEGGEFFFERVLFGVVGGGELRLELRDFFRKFLREVFGVAEVFEGEFGDFVEAVGGDADLLGGGADRAGEARA